MADTNAEAEIRGLDIDKLAKGFADEVLVLKRYVTVSKTKAREIRWYQRTAGFLDSVDTTTISTSQIANVAFKARPVSAEQSWTRQDDHVRKYFVESPLISEEDIKDSDIDILAGNVRALVRGVSNQSDKRIYAVLTPGSGINTAAATGTGWDDTSTGNPILDLLAARQTIRSYGYNPKGAIVYINSIEEKNLVNYLITVKGSSIPEYSSGLMDDPVAMGLLGLKIVVSENATTDQAVVFVNQRACTWKSFMPITSAVIKDPGIGRKIRCWEEGEAILTDPRAVHLITDTVT